MEKELLLEKFFTQSISEEETIRLNSLLESDPEFKKDFDSLNNFDKNIGNSDSIITPSDLTFLEFAKNNFVQTTIGVAASASIASTATTTTTLGKLSTILATNSLYLGAAGAIVIGSIATFVAIQKPNSNNLQNSNNKTSSIEKNIITSNPIKEDNLIENNIVENKNKTISSKKELQQNNTSQSIEYNTKTQSLASNEIDAKGTITENRTTNIDESLQNKINDLNVRISSGDWQNAALIAKTIALTYKLKVGFEIQAKEYYYQTIQYANKAKLHEIEGEVYGEIALIDYKLGDLSAYNKNKDNCFEILSKLNSNKLDNWKTKLNK